MNRIVPHLALGLLGLFGYIGLLLELPNQIRAIRVIGFSAPNC